MDAIPELEDRLRRYGAERYPVQRATSLFHLGALLTATEPDRACALLAESVALFERAGLRQEAAKARNAHGAALRQAGELDAAAEAFAVAAEELAEPLERAAALFNLGVVTRNADTLAEARELFAARGAQREEAAATRELGAALLERGALESAVDELTRALDAADRNLDGAALGAAANVLGLALLAAGRVDEAVDALRRAVSANPRSLRPHEYALAKANLALAYERSGDARRARLAARQARGVAGVPAPVARQAESTLARLGRGTHDLVPVLAEGVPEDAAELLRDELARWADADDDELSRAAAEWCAAAPDDELAEALLGALLELPPEPTRRIVEALADYGLADQLRRVASRFHAPQELRVRELLARWS